VEDRLDAAGVQEESERGFVGQVDPSRSKAGRGRRVPVRREHVVSALVEKGSEAAAQEPPRAGDEDAQGLSPP
jgi:hypothetical protein